MAPTPPSSATSRDDLLRAMRFARDQFANWQQQGLLSSQDGQTLASYCNDQTSRLEAGKDTDDLRLRPATICWDCKRELVAHQDYCAECGAPVQGDNATRLRYLIFTCQEVQKHAKAGRMPLTVSHALLADGNGQIVALRKTLDKARALMPEVVEEREPPRKRERPKLPAREPEPPPEPRRPLIEIILDPTNIQWLLAIGGVLLVLGLVIYLAASGFFKNPLNAAIVLGVGNAALLTGGWATVLRSRYQLAGRALTLLACLAMPLNLWFYDSQELITVEHGGLWIPALIICVLYAISARILKDAVFVYTLVAGVIMTGLLILADRNPANFWQISIPSTMLVVIGLICIHVERAFPPDEGPFSRQRFGLAFFWSGHASLAAGLLLLLGAQLAGGPLYPVFQSWYAHWEAKPSPVVTEFSGKLLALVLVLLGTYAYIYSDIVVRRIGVYLSLAVGTLLWAEILAINLIEWPMNAIEVVILTLSLTGLVVNLALKSIGEKQERLARSAAPLALLLSVVPVVLGVYLYFLTVPGQFLSTYKLTWTYVGVMAVTAICCRVAAQLREGQRGLATMYHFGTGASLLVGLVGLLVTVNPSMEWHQRAPFVILLPIAYLIAARMSRGTSREEALNWVAHTGVVVMLISSIHSATEGFVMVRHGELNLYLALFFAEAAVFYALEAAFRREGVMNIEGMGVYGTAIMSAAAVWQVLAYFDVSAQIYILGFAGVGLALLACYRFMVLEQFKSTKVTEGAFWAGSALMLVGSTAGALWTLFHLPHHLKSEPVGPVVVVPAVLAVFGLLAIVFVRETNWRRIYVVSTIAQAGLTVLTLAVLGNLTTEQKVEIVAVVLGLLLLITGHIGLFREKDRHDDLVSFSLSLGCLLAGFPLVIATIACRLKSPPPFDTFHVLNELTMLAVGLLLLATGFMFQIKSTTMTGAILSILWLLSLVLYARLPEALQTTAIYLMIGGGVFFGTGLLLSIYRDRLLTLPDRFKRREGFFRVLTWR